MNKEEIEEFYADWNKLLSKYKLDDVICTNWDNDEMGNVQMSKIIDTEQGKYLILAFSGRGDVLCQTYQESNCKHGNLYETQKENR